MRKNLQKINPKSRAQKDGSITTVLSSIFIINNIISGIVNVTIRNAAADDILPIKRILSQYILETEHVEGNLGQFIVAEDENGLVGCACLDTNSGLLELRSIAVLPGWKHKGIGRKMFDILRRRAIRLSDKLFIRTTARDFFEKLGFEALDNSQKPVIWQDCARCDKFQVCLQVPMMLELGSC